MRVQEIKRSLLFSLEFANTDKKKFLDSLWEEYRKALQYFVDKGFTEDRFPTYEDVKNYPYDTWLSKRYLGCALAQATDILKSIFEKKKKGKKISKPEIKRVSSKLDQRFYKFEKGENSFDFWFRLRDPEGQRWTPVKNYDYAKKIL
ncbi:hypothetical protein [Hydrogenobacter thermophilus]|uniref:hypothetical protein n=1 Tax=Hydrogenobacter thermophilus TaxID=940 RepID=UPI0030F9AA12